jgi:hypothetical protein
MRKIYVRNQGSGLQFEFQQHGTIRFRCQIVIVAGVMNLQSLESALGMLRGTLAIQFAFRHAKYYLRVCMR